MLRVYTSKYDLLFSERKNCGEKDHGVMYTFSALAENKFNRNNRIVRDYSTRENKYIKKKHNKEYLWARIRDH